MKSVNSVYSKFSSSYQAFAANLVVITEPTSYYAACKHPVLCEAMAVELAALEAKIS